MDWLPQAQIVTIPSVAPTPGNSPKRVVLLTTEMRSSDASFERYEACKTAPHLTVEVDSGKIYQHLPLSAISEGSKKFINNPLADGDTAVVAIVGQAANVANFPIAWLDNLGDVIFQILDSFSIPAVAPKFYGTQVANILAPDAPQRFNSKEWAEFSGVCGMQHVPRSNSWAPGNLDVQSILDSRDPSVSPLPPFEATLKKNSRNSLVPVWQKAIGVEETGRFDAATIAATKKLQESLMIEATGCADETTWNAAAAISAKRDLLGPYPSRSIRLGSHGPHVARWQAFLGVATDGMFGVKTEEATRDFQRSIPIQPTGSVDAKTWAKARFKLLQA